MSNRSDGDARMTPDAVKESGGEDGPMKALRLLWWNVHCHDAAHRRECEKAYHVLAERLKKLAEDGAT